MMSQPNMSLLKMLQRKRSASEAEEEESARDSEGRMVMRLHIVRGSFTGSADRGQCAMDAAVWSKMPEDIMWRVLLLLPVVKRLQFQLVKFCKLLASADFRKSCAAAAPTQLEERVVACVSPGGDSSSSSSSTRSRLKVVDIDLSFVPSEFWTSDSYSVVAAADGLVCISNDSVRQHIKRTKGELWGPKDKYCVLNPLTRTCILLPGVPFILGGWLPPTPTTLTVHGYASETGQYTDCRWALAAYDLTTGGAGRWAAVGHNGVYPGPLSTQRPTVAQCAGTTYWLWGDRVHVLEPGHSGRLVDAVPPLKSPLRALLGARSWWSFQVAFLVAHRGTVFLVGGLVPRDNTRLGEYGLSDEDVEWRVWQLTSDRTGWQLVARLDATGVERAVGVNNLDGLEEREVEVLGRLGCLEGGDVIVYGAHAVRELVCCRVEVTKKLRIPGEATKKSRIPGRDPLCCIVGFNLDTGEWEPVHDDQALLRDVQSEHVILGGKAVELNPNLFLC